MVNLECVYTNLQKLILDSEGTSTTPLKLIVDTEVRGTTLQKLIVDSEVWVPFLVKIEKSPIIGNFF